MNKKERNIQEKLIKKFEQFVDDHTVSQNMSTFSFKELIDEFKRYDYESRRQLWKMKRKK